ncbi:MAG: hypothetical protein BWY81_01295 [Firmicutes bacterium ADurb.Bin467]|nr:MAG: hypothetical protein BWY81_01295 [Firmicutes bacterium ADurb.Bin467]
MKMAEDSLKTIRLVRRRRALQALEEEVKTADAQQRRELYQRIQELQSELE